MAVAPAMRHAFVSVENVIAVVDVRRLDAAHRVAVGASPRGVALDAGSSTLFAAGSVRTKSTVGRAMRSPSWT